MRPVLPFSLRYIFSTNYTALILQEIFNSVFTQWPCEVLLTHANFMILTQGTRTLNLLQTYQIYYTYALVDVLAVQ
jgi:hypothetical protein